MRLELKKIIFIMGAFLRLEAVPILVNTTGDDISMFPQGIYTTGGASVNLRGALNFINSQSVGSPTIYNITFDSTQFTGPTKTITLSAALPPLGFPIGGQNFTANPLTITLNGSLPSNNFITIVGSNAFRPFYAHQGNITLSNLQIQNGQAVGGTGGTPAGGAGAGLG